MKESKENRGIGHSSYSFTGTGRCLSAVFLVVIASRRILATPKLGQFTTVHSMENLVGVPYLYPFLSYNLSQDDA